jgi:hypothetical protein
LGGIAAIMLIGPIGGLHAGAEAAAGDLLFVAACDMPSSTRRLSPGSLNPWAEMMQRSPAGTKDVRAPACGLPQRRPARVPCAPQFPVPAGHDPVPPRHVCAGAGTPPV